MLYLLMIYNRFVVEMYLRFNTYIMENNIYESKHYMSYQFTAITSIFSLTERYRSYITSVLRHFFELDLTGTFQGGGIY